MAAFQTHKNTPDGKRLTIERKIARNAKHQIASPVKVLARQLGVPAR